MSILSMFCLRFSVSNCLDTRSNVSIPSDQNVSIVLVSNIYNRNIGTFRRRKFCMKSWYNSKSLWMLLIFLAWLFGSKNSWYPQLTYSFGSYTWIYEIKGDLVKALTREYKRIINRITRNLYILKIYYISVKH